MKLNVIENFTKETIITPNTIIKGDCLEVMKNIEKGSIDLVLTDPPYQMTACKWDEIIDFDLMWGELKRFRNYTTPIVLFGSEPFSSHLRMSNIKEFKYDWVWEKNIKTNFLHAKNQPLRGIENIIVFYKKCGRYFPIKTKGHKPTQSSKGSSKGKLYHGENIRNYKGGDTERYPDTLINNIKVVPRNERFHPTQKPVALLEYLIKTYTNEGDTVLDFTSGSFSTAIACINTNRKFIGIEKDEKYFEVGKNRIIERLNELK